MNYRVTANGKVVQAPGGGDFTTLSDAQTTVRNLGTGNIRAVKA